MFSQITYTGDGSTELFTIPFDYIKREYVKVEVDALETVFTWETQQSVRISPPPEVGSSVTIYRKTDISKPSVEFTNASVVSATAHNYAYKANLHVVQEAYDSLEGVAERAQASAERAERESQEAQDARDTTIQYEQLTATTKSEIETLHTAVTNLVTQAQGKVDAASVEADRAATEATNAANEADRAESLAMSVQPVLNGGIIFFNGSVNTEGRPINPVTGEPDLAYGVCDGRTYTSIDGRQVTTPNCIDRFIVVAGGKYTAGSTGGAESVTLTENEMPVHKHRSKVYNGGASNPSHIMIDDQPSTRPQYSSYDVGDYAGGGAAHENRPPYFGLFLIQKL